MSTNFLADLDTPRPLEPDPAVWRRNLAAIHAIDPALAAALSKTPLPPDWRPVAALDDAPTWRIETPGSAARWLDDSAAPRTRATALLRNFRASDANVLVCEIGSGAEVAELLRRLPTTLAVFAFVERLETLAAVLRLRDWSGALDSRRLALSAPGHEAAGLSERLRREVGLNPPTGLIKDARVSPERVRACQQIVAALIDEIGSAREARMREVRAALRATPRSAAILALAGGAAPDLADAIVRGALACDWRAMALTARDPRDGHPLAALEKLGGVAPEVALGVGHDPALLHMGAGRINLRWMIEPPIEADRGAWHSTSEDQTIWLGASARICDTLRRVMPQSTQVAPFYWAVDAQTPEFGEFSDEVFLIGALPDDGAASLGVTQPTHIAIWEAARAIAEKKWNQPLIYDANGLLRAAESVADARMGDEAVRARMIVLMEHALIPAVVTRRIVEACAAARVPVTASGAGWERMPDVRRVEPIWRRGASGPRAVIVAGWRDAFSRDIVESVARGAPLVIHDPGGGNTPARSVAEVVAPSETNLFSGGPALQQALLAIGRDFEAARRKCAAARRRALTSHTWAARWRALTATGPLMRMATEVPSPSGGQS